MLKFLVQIVLALQPKFNVRLIFFNIDDQTLSQLRNQFQITYIQRRGSLLHYDSK